MNAALTFLAMLLLSFSAGCTGKKKSHSSSATAPDADGSSTVVPEAVFIQSIAWVTSTGYYTNGARISLVVTFSGIIDLPGNPRITWDEKSQLNPAVLTDFAENRFTFTTIVNPGDKSPALSPQALSGAEFPEGLTVDLALPALVEDRLIVVDTSPPPVPTYKTTATAAGFDLEFVTDEQGVVQARDSPLQGVPAKTSPTRHVSVSMSSGDEKSLVFHAVDKAWNYSAPLTVKLSRTPLTLEWDRFRKLEVEVGAGGREFVASGFYSGQVYGLRLAENGITVAGLSCPDSANIFVQDGVLIFSTYGLTKASETISCNSSSGPVGLTFNVTQSRYEVLTSSQNISDSHYASREPRYDDTGKAIYVLANDGEKWRILRREGDNLQVLRRAGDSDLCGGNISQFEVSADGRHVVYRGYCPELVTKKIYGERVFRLDVKSGQVTVVTEFNGDPLIEPYLYFGLFDVSPNGRYIAFEASENFFPGTTTTQMYLRDMTSGDTRLVSTADGTVAGQADSSATRPVLTNDHVFFSSTATNLVAGASGRQIFRVPVGGGAAELVSTSDGTVTGMGTGSSYPEDVTSDGRYLAFTSDALNWFPGVSLTQAYRKDLLTGSIVLVSSANGSASGASAGSVSRPRMSSDGQSFVFIASASSFNQHPVTSQQVFRKDLASSQLYLISRNADNQIAPSGVSQAAVSPSGLEVAFVTKSDLEHPSNASLYFDTTYLFGGAGLSKVVAQTMRTRSMMTFSDPVFVSGNGRYVIFKAFEEVSGLYRIYRRDMVNGALELVKIGGKQIEGSNFSLMGASHAGDAILLYATSLNLITETLNSATQIYLLDLKNDVVKIVSSADGSASASANNSSFSGATMSSDGRYVAFCAAATNLVTGTALRQVFLRDLQTETVSLVSSADGTIATQGNNHCYNAMISGNGQYVYFMTTATNLFPGTASYQILRKSLATGVIDLASSLDGTPATMATAYLYNQQVSEDGQYLMMMGTNLGFSSSDRYEVFVKSMASGVMTQVSDNTDPAASYASCRGTVWSYGAPKVVYACTLSDDWGFVVREGSKAEIYTIQDQTRTPLVPMEATYDAYQDFSGEIGTIAAPSGAGSLFLSIGTLPSVLGSGISRQIYRYAP